MISFLMLFSAIEYGLVAYAAYYRLKHQDYTKPEIRHVPYTGIGCVICFLMNFVAALFFWDQELSLELDMFMFLFALAQATGMGSVSVSIFLTIKDIASQPVRLDETHLEILEQEKEYQYQQLLIRIRQDRRKHQLERVRALHG